MKTKTFTISILVLFTFLLGQSALGNGQQQGLNGIQSASAQSGSFSGTGQEVFCRNGSRDWTSFISALISYDDFTEYWKDITGVPPKFINSRYTANYCLFLDIDNLMKKITKAREQIRKAFYVCDSNISKLKVTYYKLEAELFFLRKFVDVGNGQLLEVKDEEVYNQLRDYFILDKNFLSPEEAKKLFTQFKSKYQARLEAYKNCEDPTWENLILKLKELKEHVTGGFGIKESAEKVGKSFDKVVNTPLKRTGNLLGGFLDAKINDVSPQEALSDFMTELEENLPDGYTFDTLNTAKKEDIVRYDNAISRATYLGQYEHLYKASSADSITSIVDRLKYLEQTIKATFPYINQTSQCTKGILDKAC